MKYIIGESRLNDMVYKFLMDQLGTYKKSEIKDGPIIGKFFNDGKITATIFKHMNQIIDVSINTGVLMSTMGMFSLSKKELSNILTDKWSHITGGKTIIIN